MTERTQGITENFIINLINSSKTKLIALVLHLLSSASNNSFFLFILTFTEHPEYYVRQYSTIIVEITRSKVVIEISKLKHDRRALTHKRVIEFEEKNRLLLGAIEQEHTTLISSS